MMDSLYFDTFHVKLENKENKLNFLDNLFERKMVFGWKHFVDKDWDEIEYVNVEEHNYTSLHTASSLYLECVICFAYKQQTLGEFYEFLKVCLNVSLPASPKQLVDFLPIEDPDQKFVYHTADD